MPAGTVALQHARRRQMRLEVSRRWRRFIKGVDRMESRGRLHERALRHGEVCEWDARKDGDTCEDCDSIPVDGVLFYHGGMYEYNGAEGSYSCARCLVIEAENPNDYWELGLWWNRRGGAPKDRFWVPPRGFRADLQEGS